MHSKEQWDKVYTSKSAASVSWYQEHAGTSLRLIAETGVLPEAQIIDVGGGASTLVDDLLAGGFRNIAVLDLSAAALQAAQSRLGNAAGRVNWISGDITDIQLPQNHFDVWHDRAVFHFLVTPEARAAYRSVLNRSLKPGGHLILATFAEDGPTQCSGLPVRNYSVTELETEVGSQFNLLHAGKEQHTTPSGAIQNFIYCLFRKAA
jgi:2-polyprenyl-3-methyl-5-hydroxy-6-metoxy-1,4-benzoquinol methylase